jgi:Tol biopolymer transport system component
MSGQKKDPGNKPENVSAFTALKAPILIFAGLFVVSVIIISAAWWINPRPAASTFFTNLRLTKLTGSGKAINAAISPDGKYVAYVLKEKDAQSVWLRQLSAGSDMQIIAPAADTAYSGLAFSPDGSSLYFLKGVKGSFNSIFRTSNMGGKEEKLAENADSPPGISPDGKTLAFIRGLPDQKETALFTVSTDSAADNTGRTGGGEPHRIAARDTEKGFVLSARPSWSPTGESLTCAVKERDENGEYNGLISVDIITGDVKNIQTKRFLQILQAAWTPDARNLLIAGTTEESGKLDQLWLADLLREDARRITNDLYDYRELSLTGDGRIIVTIATVQTDERGESVGDVALISDTPAQK